MENCDTRWECESNESVHERYGISFCINGVKCGVVEWVKKYTYEVVWSSSEKVE